MTYNKEKAVADFRKVCDTSLYPIKTEEGSPQIEIKEITNEEELQKHQELGGLVILFKSMRTDCYGYNLLHPRQKFMLKIICKYIQEQMKLSGLIHYAVTQGVGYYECLSEKVKHWAVNPESYPTRVCQLEFGKNIIDSFEMEYTDWIIPVRNAYLSGTYGTMYDGKLCRTEILDVIIRMCQFCSEEVAVHKLDENLHADFESAVRLTLGIVSILKEANKISLGAGDTYESN